MKKVLEKQLAALEKIEKDIHQDKVIQLSQVVAQIKTDKDLKKDQEETNERLDKINQTLKDGLGKESSKSLNSNVIKLFKEVEKQTKVISTKSTKSELTLEKSKQLTEKSMNIEQFKTVGERVKEAKTDFSKFFTLRGFLDKTNIVSAENKGIVGTALAKREAKQQYIKDRMETDPGLINLKQYGGDKEKLKADLAIQFDKQQKIKREQRASVEKSQGYEKEMEGLRERGYSEEKIKKTSFYKKYQGEMETQRDINKRLAEVDPRYREKNNSKLADEKKSTAEAAPFSDEGQLEAARLQERQVGLLERIAENTEYLKNLGGGGGGLARREREEGEEGEGGGLGAGIAAAAGGLLAKGKAIGKAVLRGGKALGRGIMNIAKAPLTGVAKFAAPLAAGLSVGEGISDLAEGKKVEELSQVVPEGWDKLNPFSWAMRGGMYAGEKINKGYSAVSEKLGGSGSLGSDIYEGVQKVKGFGSDLGTKISEKLGGSGSLGSDIYEGVQRMKSFGSSLFSWGDSKKENQVVPTVPATVPSTKPIVVNPSTPVYDASANNVMLADKAATSDKQPIIVSAPTTNIANNRQSIVASTPIRNEDSSMENYMKRRSFAM